MNLRMWALLPLVLGCSDADESSTGAPKGAAEVAPAALVASAWQVRLADNAARAPFESHPGWGALFQRNHPEAMSAFGAEPVDAIGLARTHAELSGLYRQAALMGANAASHVYGTDRFETDPAEVSYLVGIAEAFQGRCPEAKAAFASVESPAAALADRVGWWAGWADAGCVWPPRPDTVFVGAGREVVPGTMPEAGPVPSFQLVERSDEARVVDFGDPTEVWLLALWHEDAARAAGGADAEGVLQQWLVPYLLPAEPGPVAEVQAVPDGWLFAGFADSPADLAFQAAARAKGVAAIETWKDRSAAAAALVPAVEEGKLNPELVLDQAAGMGAQVQAAMVGVAGQEEGHHRAFGDHARLSLLRIGMVLADANDQYRDAGILRVNALERSEGPLAHPPFLISTAAWDAGNRNPMRAQELVHRHLSRFPALAVARPSLDALHIRLSRISPVQEKGF